MNRCRKYEQLFEKAVIGELNKTEEELLYGHLETCAECAEKLSGLKNTLAIFRSVNKHEPDPDFMDNFWEMLEPKLIDENTSEKSFLNMIWLKNVERWKNLKYTFGNRLTLKHQLAGGFILLIAGILIGRYIITESKIDIQDIVVNNNQNIRVTGQLYHDTEEYMQRSKILFLSMMNYDASADEIETISLIQQQKLSKELLRKASVLKEELKDVQLKNLVSDIELVLLQISNLEVKYDLSGIELIKEGVDSKGLILKINIQEMNTDKEKVNEYNNTQITSPGI